MEIQHLCVKRFVKYPERIDLRDFLTIFNEWIQHQVCDELMIDVADYRHVIDGPGVVLVGHEATYSMDQNGGRLGLLYSRKAIADDAPATRVSNAMRAILTAGDRLLSHPRLSGDLEFDDREFLFTVNDRLLAPNSEASFEAFSGALQSALGDFFDEWYVTWVSADPRKRLSARVSAPGGLKSASVKA